MPLPRNKVAKAQRSRLRRSSTRPIIADVLYHTIPPSSVPFHTSSEVKMVLESLEELVEMSHKEPQMGALMALSLCTEHDHIFSWIFAFVSSIQTTEDDPRGFYRRLLSVSANLILRFAFESIHLPPSHPDDDGDVIPFADKLTAKQGFLADLELALDWIEGCCNMEAELYFNFVRTIYLLYKHEALRMFADLNGPLGGYMERYKDLRVTSRPADLLHNEMTSQTILVFLKYGNISQERLSSRAWVMQIVCRKLRRLCALLEDWPSFSRELKIPLGSSISYCLQSITLLTGHGGDSPALRMLLDEGVLRSIYQANTVLADASWWSDGEDQRLLGYAIQKTILHVTASLPFPRVRTLVRQQLKTIDIPLKRISESLPPTVSAAATGLEHIQGVRRMPPEALLLYTLPALTLEDG
ncbi:hypothetical protein PQX77_011718 [Marasmius sp. AFHP31]|nr:hypothetical protein PQX77_011718 [Marasmius sp. AFHP31]